MNNQKIFSPNKDCDQTYPLKIDMCNCKCHYTYPTGRNCGMCMLSETWHQGVPMQTNHGLPCTEAHTLAEVITAADKAYDELSDEVKIHFAEREKAYYLLHEPDKERVVAE